MKSGQIFCISLLVVVMLGISSCSTKPGNAVAVHPFDKGKYLGKWYEVARMDFKFEKDLINTTAEYSLNKDGSIKVLNKGYNPKEGTWKQATGKAKFVGDEKTAMLKVSFFGPFYAGYNVIAIDDQYKYALVCGKNLKYLWILSRETSIPEEIKERYLKIARDIGYDVSKLLWVKHENPH